VAVLNPAEGGVARGLDSAAEKSKIASCTKRWIDRGETNFAECG
jgi:hypothetical protein